MIIFEDKETGKLLKQCSLNEEHTAPLFARYCPLCKNIFEEEILSAPIWSKSIMDRSQSWKTLIKYEHKDVKFYLSEFNDSLLLICSNGDYFLWVNSPATEDKTIAHAPPRKKLYSLDCITQVTTAGTDVYILNKGKVYTINWHDIVENKFTPNSISSSGKIKKMLYDAKGIYYSSGSRLYYSEENNEITVFDFSEVGEVLYDFCVQDGTIYTLSGKKQRSAEQFKSICIRTNHSNFHKDDRSLQLPLRIDVEQDDFDENACNIAGNEHYFTFRYNSKDAYFERHDKLLTMIAKPWKLSLDNIINIMILDQWLVIVGDSETHIRCCWKMSNQPQIRINNLLSLGKFPYISYDNKSLLFPLTNNIGTFVAVKPINEEIISKRPPLPGRQLKDMFVVSNRIIIQVVEENFVYFYVGIKDKGVDN